MNYQAAKAAYDVGDMDNPYLQRIVEEIDIEAAERGCDRDMNAVDLEAWKESRLEQELNKHD